MRTIDIHEAKANLIRLVEQAAGGKSFLIAISGTPRVMVLPLESKEAGHPRRVGLLERCLVVTEEVDASSRPRSSGCLKSQDDAAAEDRDFGSAAVVKRESILRRDQGELTMAALAFERRAYRLDELPEHFIGAIKAAKMDALHEHLNAWLEDE